jgi:CP family cyanate transporter-like MFS transporter
MMALGSSVAAGVSVPLTHHLGWRGVLGLWTVPAIIALIVWLPQLRTHPAAAPAQSSPPVSPRHVWRSPLAWQVAAFMGLQSLTFYVLLAWLPELLQSRGMTAERAGWMLALSQGTGIIGSAIVPILAMRFRDQRSTIWALGALEGIALAGFFFGALSGLTTLWVVVIGFVLGGTFGLALLLLVLRSPDPESTTRLSGMAQAIGYTIAVGAAGVVFFGTWSWLIALPVTLVWAFLTRRTTRAWDGRHGSPVAFEGEPSARRRVPSKLRRRHGRGALGTGPNPAGT